jgi:hypothetical protein
MQNLVNSVITDWLGPILIVMIAALSLMFIVRKQWVSALSFAGLAIIVSLFVFFGPQLFGKSGNLTGVGNKLSQQINTVVVDNPVAPPLNFSK